MAIVRTIFILLIALVLGLGIAVFRIASIQNNHAFTTYGSWQGTTNLALNRDDLVTTQVSVFALFALPSYEAVYLFAAKDDQQNRLNGNEKYTITGNTRDIKAEYWSITAYGKDLYLMPNEQNRYSFNANNLITDSAGNFKITVSAEKTEGNWLPVIKDKKFQLVFRIYQGQKDFIDHLDKTNLPAIKRI